MYCATKKLMYAQPTVTDSCTMTSSWLTRLFAILKMSIQPKEQTRKYNKIKNDNTVKYYRSDTVSVFNTEPRSP